MPDELPLELTIHALDAAGVSRALISAWWGPQGALGLDDETKQLLLHDNAARVFGPCVK